MSNYKTPKQAIEASIKLWTYLAEHPSVDKDYAYNALDMVADLSDCPLCDYTFSKSNSCISCPAFDEWVDYKDLHPSHNRNSICECECNKMTPWWKWLRAKSDGGRARCAKDMIALLERANEHC